MAYPTDFKMIECLRPPVLDALPLSLGRFHVVAVPQLTPP